MNTSTSSRPSVSVHINVAYIHFAIVSEVRLVKPNAKSETLDYETNGLCILLRHYL